MLATTILADTLAVLMGLGSLSFYIAAFFYPEVHRRLDIVWSGLGLLYSLVLWFGGAQMTALVLLGQVIVVGLVLVLGWQTLAVRREKTPVPQQTPVVITPEMVSGWAKNTVNQLRIAPAEPVPLKLEKRSMESRVDPRRRPVYDYEFVEDGILEEMPTEPVLEEAITELEAIPVPTFAEAEVLSVEVPETEAAKTENPATEESETESLSEPLEEADLEPPAIDLSKTEDFETKDSETEQSEVDNLQSEGFDTAAAEANDVEVSDSEPAEVEGVETEHATQAEVAIAHTRDNPEISRDTPEVLQGDGPRGDDPSEVNLAADSAADSLGSDDDWGDDWDEALTVEASDPTGGPKILVQPPAKPSLIKAPIILFGWVKDVVTSLTKPKPSKPVIEIPRRDPPPSLQKQMPRQPQQQSATDEPAPPPPIDPTPTSSEPPLPEDSNWDD